LTCMYIMILWSIKYVFCDCFMPKYNGIQKKRNRWYWYIYHDNTVTWSSGGFKTAVDAARDRVRAHERITKNTYVPSKKISVTRFIEQYTKDYAFPNLRKSTVKKFESISRLYVVPTLGSMKLQDVKLLHIQRVFNKVKREHTPNVAYQVMRTLRKIFNKAVEWEILEKNPMAYFRISTPTKAEHSILTPKQLFELVDRLSGMDKYVVALAGFTALRRSEIFGLMWQDVDFNNNTLSLKRQFLDGEIAPLKTEASRAVIPIWPKLTKMLKEWRLQCQSFKWVFHGKGDKPYAPESWVSKRWSRIRREHDLPQDLRFHDLRHTFASILFSKGIDVGDVQKLLRHSSYRTTVDVYRHLLPDQLSKALKTLDELSIEHSIEHG